jgi:hypothetical protein
LRISWWRCNRGIDGQPDLLKEVPRRPAEEYVEVCRFTPEKPGHIQMVCCNRVHLVVLDLKPQALNASVRSDLRVRTPALPLSSSVSRPFWIFK